MSKLQVRVLKASLILLIPIVIVLGVVRLVATEPYLSFEYSKPDFPEDPFGFDRTIRLAHAADNFQFVTADQPLEDLARQKHNDALLYDARELKHMEDVQNVYQTVWQVWQFALTMTVVSGLALIWRKENRPAFASSIRWGGAVTVGLVLVIGLVTIVAWQGWFVLFHRVFFAIGSWSFDFSNTLIRLFPEKFWFDAVLTISILSVIAGFLTYWMGTRLLKSASSKYDLSEIGKIVEMPTPTNKYSPVSSGPCGQGEVIIATKTKYIPVFNFRWLTPLYDPFLKWGMRERTFKRRLIRQANIRPGMRVLDLGCGTGTLTILIKQTHPKVEVVGLDGDQAVLEIARSKADQAGVNIAFDHGMAFQLPYPNNSFNRVLSSLVFHHLSTENKQLAMCEIYRVLRAGGELHIVDFGKPRSIYAKLISLVMRRLEETADNIQGLLPEMIRKAGFEQVEEPVQYTTIVGGLSLFRAKI